MQNRIIEADKIPLIEDPNMITSLQTNKASLKKFDLKNDCVKGRKLKLTV